MSVGHLRSIKDLQRGQKLVGGEDGDPAADLQEQSPGESDGVDLRMQMGKLRALGEADKALILTLQARLEEQRKLDVVAMSALQRSYEKLSAVRACPSHRSGG